MRTTVIKFLFFVITLIFPAVLYAQINDGAVIPGDFADPSIIKVNDTYYATGTSSEWAPHFPIFKSTDLKNWKQSGYVFDKMPDWAMGSFWAPEYYKIGDTYFIYYTARRKSDNTSFIGVASSKFPDKDFKDHGVMIAYGKEAIDAFIVEDNGQRYITFKAYGLDNRPIELLAYKLSADGLKTEGEPFSLLKDDQKKGMEGQSFLKRDGYFYLFYSAGGCCGTGCSYNVRVARAKTFAGPYEIYGNNPILFENDKWKCMGHGTFVKGPDDRDMYLHHAYNKQSTNITGRQGLVSELTWPEKGGWPVFKTQQIFGGAIPNTMDNFKAKAVGRNWQWDMRNSTPSVKQAKGVLTLSGTVTEKNNTGIVLTDRPASGSFVMTATVLNHNAALKGLSFYGDANMAIGIGTENDQVVLWQVTDNKYTSLAQSAVNAKQPVQLKMELAADRTCTFFYKQGKEDWKALTSQTQLRANRLPQWDRSPRPGLHFKGSSDLNAQFTSFSIVNR
ncbi:glycoside hydrolase family 43 protein [Mucilaginibacter myungsuensis]|uniref:Family 43 glycosylhydrolase n=1 Tax=Mucilaginibacter myungsuensis TaxID=649104 RepID=A0A929PU67_9SPHI|nr:glycoside hydrolase family 43 protein [Mucilaginibacter myungsuensis]MBE9660423.1 family 43 glycosylhydrolase [Mucilaginibacter myungsuensis]MDN3600465.1 glycoside hydrolase family 43 protein [Mucilaginibacter myungsuensis]